MFFTCVVPFYAVVLLLSHPNRLFLLRPQVQQLRFVVNYCLEIDNILTIQVRFVYYSVETGIRWLPTFKGGIEWLQFFCGSRERAVLLIISFPFFPKQILDFFLRRCISLSFNISGFNCVGMAIRQRFYNALKNEMFVIEGTQRQFIG